MIRRWCLSTVSKSAGKENCEETKLWKFLMSLQDFFLFSFVGGNLYATSQCVGGCAWWQESCRVTAMTESLDGKEDDNYLERIRDCIRIIGK